MKEIYIEIEDGIVQSVYSDENMIVNIIDHDRISEEEEVYEVEQQSKGIVIANSESEAVEKVAASYGKHGDDICPSDIKVLKAVNTDGWFKDCPDMLEVISY